MNRRGRIRNWYLNCGIQKKIVLLLLLVISILTAAGSVLFYIFVQELYFDMVETSVLQMSDQAREDLENEINLHYYTSYVVQNSESIQNIISADTATFQEQYADMVDAEALMTTLTLPVSIYQISLYVNDDAFYAENNRVFRKRSDLDDYEQMDELKNSSKPYVWLPPEKLISGDSTEPVEVVSFIRKIGNNTDPIGYQRASIRISDIRKIIAEIEGVEGSFCYIYDEKTKDIICQPLEAELEQFSQQMSDHQKLLLSDKSWKMIRQDSQLYDIYARRVGGTDWIMVSVLPMKTLYTSFFELFGFWLLIILLVGSFAMYLAYSISTNITKRIKLLESNMSSLTEGHFEQIESDQTRDEIGQLINYYNDTTRQMISMARKEYEMMESLKTAELKALQAQINPHFLYNTLDLIYWRAMDADAPEVSEITQALARFYRLSLKGGQEKVSVRDEIDHALCYLEIQNYRFDNYIKCQIEIPEELYQYEIIKITLQPLIENAILHGLSIIRGKKEAVIHITGWEDVGYLFFKVKDNGAGMPKEMLAEILKKPVGGSNKGYGVYNINKRLRVSYGEECGLSFESSEGEGTEVIVKIKAAKYQSK